MVLRYRRIENLCNRIQHIHVFYRHHNCISQILITFNMGRDANLVNHIGYICLKIPFYIRHLRFIRRNLADFCSPFLPISLQALNPVQQHIMVKGLHDIVAGAQQKSVFRNSLLSNGRNDHKFRFFLEAAVLSDLFHDCQTVQLGHYDINQNNIRLLFPYNLTCFFAVSGNAHNLEFFVLVQNFLKNLHHSFVIVCNGNTPLVHPLSSSFPIFPVSFLQLHTKVFSVHSKNYRKIGSSLQGDPIGNIRHTDEKTPPKSGVSDCQGILSFLTIFSQTCSGWHSAPQGS